MSSQKRAWAAEENFELLFVTEVLKLSSLHYGYWEEGQASGEIDLDEVRRAQSLFTDKLLSFIPEHVNTVLDVGAGVDDNARALAAVGYRVTAISPDRNQVRYFDETRDPSVAFHCSKFRGLHVGSAVRSPVLQRVAQLLRSARRPTAMSPLGASRWSSSHQRHVPAWGRKSVSRALRSIAPVVRRARWRVRVPARSDRGHHPQCLSDGADAASRDAGVLGADARACR